MRDGRRSRGQLMVTEVKQMWGGTAHTALVCFISTHRQTTATLTPLSASQWPWAYPCHRCQPLWSPVCHMMMIQDIFHTQLHAESWLQWVSPSSRDVETQRLRTAGQVQVLHFSSVFMNAGSLLCTRTWCRSYSMQAHGDGAEEQLFTDI